MPAPTLRGYELSDTGTSEDVTGALAGGWAWASGGIVSTPADLNTFIRGYVGGDLYGARTRAQQQRLFIPGGESSPPGPGDNSASLALFRYRTSCGTMYGHTGNTFGYTHFAAASRNGRRSVTVAMTLQRTNTSSGQALSVFRALQHAEHAGVCLALQQR
jgi:D-alanyl-D-alanine carboxypeptidase